MTILQLVINEPDIRDGLNGVPLYLHTMITYASVFLLKVQQQWKAIRLVTDSFLTRDTVGHIIKLLNEVRASDRHLSYHIARGLTKMLERLDRSMIPDLERQGDLIQQDGTQESENQVGAGSALQGLDTGNGLGASYGPLPMYKESTGLFDENSFPIGFFDATAIGGPWQWPSRPV
jgi:hypothetical protein